MSRLAKARDRWQRRRKWVGASVVGLVSVAMLLASTPNAAAASETTATASSTVLSATLGGSPSYSGLSAWVGDGSGTPNVVTKDGVSGWETQPANNLQDYVYVGITNSSFLAGIQPSHPMTVAVTYWNGPSGSFHVRYQSTSGPWGGASQTVSLTGTDTWKTQTFTLLNAAFDSGENNGASFRISTDGSAAGVDFSKVTVAESDQSPPPTITETQLGNIFTPGQTPTFGFTTAATSPVSYQVYNYYNDEVASGTANVSGGKGTITVPGLPYGYYLLAVSDNVYGTESVPVKNSFAVLPAPPKSDSLFAFNTHLGQGEPASLLPLLTDIGVYQVRDGLSDDSTFFKAGVTPYTQAPTVTPTGETGNDTNDFGQFPSNTASINADVNSALAYLKANPKLTVIALWNEPNINNISAQNYFSYLKAFYTAVKAAYPNVLVAAPDVNEFDIPWLTTLFNLGAAKYMNVFTIHPYQAPDPPEGLATEMKQVEKFLEGYTGGKPMPIWITEAGWSTQGNASVSRSTQAAYYVRANVLALTGGVGKIYWYSGENFWLNFGVIENINPGSGPANGSTSTSPYGNGSPKPSYSAAAAMTAELANASYVGPDTVTAGSGGDASTVRAYEFKQATGTDVSVLWSTGANQTVALAASGPVTLTGAMGNKATLHPVGGEVYVTLTRNPVFVTGTSGPVIAGGAPFSASAPSSAAQSSVVPVTLTASGAAPSGLSFALDGSTYSVAAGSSKTVDETTSSMLGAQTLWTNVSVDGQAVGRLATTFQVQTEVTVKADPAVVSVSPSECDLDVTVTNNSAVDTLSVSSVDWQVGAASGTVSSPGSVPPDSTKVFRVPLASAVFNTIYPVSVVVNYDNGSGTAATSASYSGNVTFTPVIKDTLPSNWTWQDVANQPSFSLPAQGQPEAKVATAAGPFASNTWLDWSANDLYITARVYQPIFYEPDTGSDVWNGDDIQFMVSPNLPDGAATPSSEAYQYDVSLTSAGPQLYRSDAPAGVADGLVTDAGLRITRNSATHYTTYYLALPWSDLAPISASSGMFGLSMLFNMNNDNGQGRLGWWQWGSGIGYGINPALYNFTELVTSPPSSDMPAAVSVNPAAATVTKGASTTLSAQVEDQSGKNMSGQVVSWSSANPAVATVNQSGVVTGVTDGSTTVLASSDGVSVSVPITVGTASTPSATAITVSPAAASLTTGGFQTLKATVVDQSGVAMSGQTVTWSSSNAAVAAVSSAGVVTGEGPGAATITATDGTITATVPVVVAGKASSQVDLTVAPTTPLFGQEVSLTATVHPKAPGAAGPSPTGTVTFSVDGHNVGAPVSLASGTATSLLPKDLSPGSHTVKGVYSGDSNYTGSSTTQTFTVGCSQTITTHRNGPLVVTGSTCVEAGGEVDGPTTVKPGGALALIGATVHGPITSTGATAILICGSTLRGIDQFSGTTGPVTVGGATGSNCAADNMQGPLTVSRSTGPVTIGQSSVIGPVSLTDNSGRVSVAGGSIQGPLTLSHDAGGFTVSANTVHGPVSVTDNGPGSTATVSANKIDGLLACTGNSPPPSDGSTPNKVSGIATGQCAGLSGGH